MSKLTRKEVIKLNEMLGKEFKTDFGLIGEGSNLDYALSLEKPYDIAKEILRGHPFIDANKRTSLMVFMILTTSRSYEEILGDYHDVFLSLSK